MKSNKLISICVLVLIIVSECMTFSQSNLQSGINKKIVFIDSSKVSFLSKPCQIHIPNSYGFTYRSQDKPNENYFFEKFVNIDSFNLILSQEIQLALYKTLLLSNYKEEFKSSFLKNIRNETINQQFPIAQVNGEIQKTVFKFIHHANPDYNNFYENFYENLNLQQLQKVLKENGNYNFTVPICVELNEQVEKITFTCNNGCINVIIPAKYNSNHLTPKKTVVLATQNFFSTKEKLSFQLLNPFRFYFLSCSGIPDSELEKFDLESKQWKMDYSMKNHKDCGNSLNSYKVNDSIFNFNFLPQAPGLYRIVVKAPSKFIPNDITVKHQDLYFYSDPFYVDDFISFSEQQFFNQQDTVSKKIPFYFYKDSKKVTKNCFYYSHQYIINSIKFLPHLDELTQKSFISIIGNVNIELPISKNDPNLYFQPIAAHNVIDPYGNMLNYPHYYSIFGRYVTINGESAVLKNTYNVTLSAKAKRNDKLLKQFLAESNLKLVGISPNRYAPKGWAKIKPNDTDIFFGNKDSKKWMKTKTIEAVIQLESTNPIEIIQMTEKMKKSKLFSILSNNIYYLSSW